jgi:chromosome segregation ATPase
MDQNKYINTYIDITVGQLHEYLNTSLQLKTQAKLANDLIQEKDQIIGSLQNQLDSIQNNNNDVQIAKDQIIGSLQNQLNSIQNNNNDVQIAKDQAKHWEDSYHAMSNKLAHMETLLNQLKEMKSLIQEKDKTIASLNDQIEDLKTPKKVINTKVKKLEVIKEKQPTDDF